MENIVLEAEPRGVGRHQVRELRNRARVPAVLYGQKQQPTAISVDSKALNRALHAAGSGLMSLQVGTQEPVRVLAREVQRDPIKHHTLHVDFLAVSMTQELRLDIPIVSEGEAPILKQQNFVLVRNLDTVEIECLPSDIPNHLVANLSKLATEDDTVFVRDLLVPPGVRILTEPDQAVFSVTTTRAAVEEEEVAEEVSAEDVEVVAKGKAARETEEIE